MLHFDTDYMEGAHPEVMRRLMETNLEQTSGYGSDDYTRHARELIRQACGQPEAGVYFLVGGTQTNATVIDGLLARHEGVLGAETAHINVHEAGAIEASGHKVLTLPQHEGKLCAEEVEAYIADFTVMKLTNTWWLQEWCIFLTLLNMVHCTRSVNWRL